MLTVDYVKSLAHELASHNDSRTAPLVKDLLDLADQLEYMEERDSITDSRLGLLKEVTESWKSEVEVLQEKLAQEHAVNLELRKQIQVLKKALYAS